MRLWPICRQSTAALAGMMAAALALLAACGGGGGGDAPAGQTTSTYQVQVTVTRLQGSAIPYRLDRDFWALEAAAAAFRSEYGRDPLYTRSGGSVPVTAVFKNVLNADTVSVGFGEPGSAVHAPNEWYTVAAFPRSRRVYADLYLNLAKGAK